LATPAGIEPATNSLEVVRKANSFNAHSDKTAVPAALSNKMKFQFVGMLFRNLRLRPRVPIVCSDLSTICGAALEQCFVAPSRQSAECRLVTGADIPVDGGFLAKGI
jgi:hypothetical protein